VAVFPDRETIQRLLALRGRLDLALPGVRWVGEGNLHFTLRFFGDLAPEDVQRAAGALEAVAPRHPAFSLELAGIGVFPGWKRPRVLWVGSGEGGEALVGLAGDLEREFRRAGLGREDKPFVPHLTLGRWRDAPSPLDPEAAGKAAGTFGPPGRFTVATVQLVRSVLSPGGSIYTPLYTARLRPS
jgi:2'-5' RNA ligase